MRVKHSLTALGLSVVMLGTMGLGLAMAAPSNAPSSTTDIVTCSNDSSSWQAVVVGNGNGMWTPGHVVTIDGSPVNETYIPLSVSGVFYPDTPVDGQSEIPLFSVGKQGNHTGVTNAFECSLAPQYFSADDPENPFGVGGDIVISVTVFEAGNSH